MKLRMMINTEHAKVHFGSNLDVLPTLEDNSVDSIVTDPPYELGFMGKSWDSSGIAYNVELWKECLRVLKPGGHLLSFGGTRTWHRVAVAIEDAGFEVRDSIAWMYGSGFPKSLDISKAIDKGSGENKQRQLKFVNWMRSTGMTAQACDKILKAAGKISPTSSRSIHYFNEGQPQIATADTFDILKPYLPEVPEEIERLVAERTGIEWTAYKNRRKIGEKTWIQGGGTAYELRKGSRKEVISEVTESHTPEAQQWEGWGTALKPAFEPIVVARKPLIGTVAQNVLEHGTGGLNIDGSRIGTESVTINTFDNGAKPFGGASGEPYSSKQIKGRWPANVILDEYSVEILDEQSGVSKSSPHVGRNRNGDEDSGSYGGSWNKDTRDIGYKDTGGASRFFYCAKASKADRNEGLEDLEAQRHSDREKSDGAGGDNPRNRTNQAKQNFHPTVKPTALMTYLLKLVTPPNGIVLDPFTGSGSTGKAAILSGFEFVGIELTEDYWPIIKGRLEHAETQLTESKEKEGEQLF